MPDYAGGSSPPSVLKGDPAGAALLVKAADALQALLAGPAVGRIGLPADAVASLKAVTDKAREMAAADKARLVTDPSVLPPEVAAALSRGVATYYHEHDLIFLEASSLSADDLNTIVHEVSHAVRRSDPGVVVMHSTLDALNASGGGAPTTRADFQLSLDHYLAKAREELQAEIIGHQAEYLATDDAQGGTSSAGNARRAEMWRSGTVRDASSRDAEKQWRAFSRGASAAGHLRNPDYETAGETYLQSGGPLPRAKEFVP